MKRRAFGLGLLLVSATMIGAVRADDATLATIKGTIVYPDAVPAEKIITQAAAVPECIAKGQLKDQTWVVNAKNKGLKNVFVWIEPADAKRGSPFPKELIHPSLVKPKVGAISIDQPCCAFEPRVVAARAGQEFTFKNSAPIPHNAKWTSANNGEINPLIPKESEYKLPAPLIAERNVITLSCGVHGWMNAYIRVYDHPYFAVTDADGKFEIPMAPAGAFKLYFWHETGWIEGKEGAKGTPIVLKAGINDLQEIKWKFPKE